jgi:hypothetical protein
MNCSCTHSPFNHHPVLSREGAVRYSLAGCAVKDCACTKYVADESSRVTMTADEFRALTRKVDRLKRNALAMFDEVYSELESLTPRT